MRIFLQFQEIHVKIQSEQHHKYTDNIIDICTVIILYGIYIALTVSEFVLLLFGGMPVFDSLLHTFGTAGTGGFGIKNSSVAYSK